MDELERLQALTQAQQEKIEALTQELSTQTTTITTLRQEIERLNRVLDQIPLEERTRYETAAAGALVTAFWDCGRSTHRHPTMEEAAACVARTYFPDTTTPAITATGG